MVLRAFAFVGVVALLGCGAEERDSSNDPLVSRTLASTGDPNAVYAARSAKRSGKGSGLVVKGAILRVDLASGAESALFAVDDPRRFEARGRFLFWMNDGLGDQNLYRARVDAPGDLAVIDAQTWIASRCEAAGDDDGAVWIVEGEVLKRRDVAGVVTPLVDLRRALAKDGVHHECTSPLFVGSRYVAVSSLGLLTLFAKDGSASVTVPTNPDARWSRAVGITDDRVYWSTDDEGDASSLMTRTLDGGGDGTLVAKTLFDQGPSVVGDGVGWCADGDPARQGPGTVYFWRPGAAAPRRLSENACVSMTTDAARVVWRDGNGAIHAATP